MLLKRDKCNNLTTQLKPAGPTVIESHSYTIEHRDKDNSRNRIDVFKVNWVMEHKEKRSPIKSSNLKPEFIELLHPGYSVNHTATLNTTLLIILERWGEPEWVVISAFSCDIITFKMKNSCCVSVQRDIASRAMERETCTVFQSVISCWRLMARQWKQLLHYHKYFHGHTVHQDGCSRYNIWHHVHA